MAGTHAHDSIGAVLHNAVAISSATTTSGTGVQVNYPGMVRFKQVAGATITGTTPTFDTEIQGSEDNSNWFTIAKFDTLVTADAGETHYVECYVNSKYVRASTLSAGTSPVATLTVTMEELHKDRVRTAPSATGQSA